MLPETFREIIKVDNKMSELLSPKVISIKEHSRIMILSDRRKKLTRLAEIYMKPKGDI